MDDLEIFLICPPGLQNLLATEAREKGFLVTSMIPGGVTMKGSWEDVWRANVALRGASRVLVRMASFHTVHMAQLDKQARALPWGEWLKSNVRVKVEANCKSSKIYHEKGAAERVARAVNEELGAPLGDGGVTVRVRIENNLCTISLDTSGEPLHKRGVKVQINKAPMRENLAAMFLRACGYDGSEPVMDPMCGSGTFVIEAAEIARGLLPGRARGFAFERFVGFDPDAFAQIKDVKTRDVEARFYGSDRDAGAIAMSLANAERAEIDDLVTIWQSAVEQTVVPEGPAGLVIVNPPYGARIGASRSLFGVYAAFGARMREAFGGWRVGMVTTDAALVKATGLPFGKPGPVIDHGGIKIRLWQTENL